MTNKIKLPAEFRSKWIAALESGKYKQDKRELKKVVSGQTYHCCLGVAAELCNHHLDKVVTKNQTVYRNQTECYTDKGYYRGPDNCLNALIWSLTSRRPIPLYRELVEMNDNGFDFNAIAKFIERETEGV